MSVADLGATHVIIDAAVFDNTQTRSSANVSLSVNYYAEQLIIFIIIIIFIICQKKR